VLIEVALVLEHLGAVLANLVGGRSVLNNHVTLNVALIQRRFATQLAFVAILSRVMVVHRADELHDIHF